MKDDLQDSKYVHVVALIAVAMFLICMGIGLTALMAKFIMWAF